MMNGFNCSEHYLLLISLDICSYEHQSIKSGFETFITYMKVNVKQINKVWFHTENNYDSKQLPCTFIITHIIKQPVC